MTKDISDKIKAYDSNSVDHLEPLKHIRTKPTMYLGSVSINPNHLFEEALMNSIDEYSVGVADHITIRIHTDGSLEVTDNGRGMPPLYSSKFKMPVVRALLTTTNTGKAFASNDATTSQNGVGMKAAVATSDWLEVTVWRDGYEYFDRYETIDGEPGIPVVKLEKNKELPKKKNTGKIAHGTRVRFLPSKEVWAHTKFDYDKIKSLAKDLSYLHPDLTLTVINDNLDETIDYHQSGGTKQYIEDYAKATNLDLITPVFEFDSTYDTGEKFASKEPVLLTAHVTFAWASGNNTKSVLFTNNVPNPLGGTPVKGFYAGIARLINKYAKDFSLSKDTLEQRDIVPGLILVISMTDPNPQFDGQTKKEITSANAKNGLNTMTFNSAQLPMDRSIEQVKEVIKNAVKRAAERKKSDESNVNLKSKEILSKVNKKLKQARKLGDGSELFIVEGDSAAGTLVNERDTTFQAVMPLRGKVLNTYKATLAKSMANVELSTIFATLGTGVGKDFDISKANYSKIIIATDADPDGSQISDLILTAFIKFTPELVKKGYIYRAMSPLYVNILKNGKEVYSYTEQDQTDFMKKHKQSEIDSVSRNKGLGELSNKEVHDTLINPETRKLLQLHLTEDNETDAYNYLEVFMGTDTSSRKEIFADQGKYVDEFN